MSKQIENKKINTKQMRKIGISNESWERLRKFFERVNMNAKRPVKNSDIVNYLILKLCDSDIPIIQEKLYTANDRIDIAWKEYQIQNPDKKITRDEFLDLMVQGLHLKVRRQTIMKLGKEREYEE